MKILILETSSEKGCIVLADKETPIAVKTLPGGPELSKCLASEVEKLISSGRGTHTGTGTKSPQGHGGSGGFTRLPSVNVPECVPLPDSPSNFPQCKAALHLRPDLIAVGIGPGSYTGIRVGTALAKALSYGWQIPLIGFCSLKAFAPKIVDPYIVLVDARMGGFYALIDQKPTLISPSDPLLQTIPHIASPHPELIKKRLSSSAIWHETAPDPDLMAQLCFRQFLEEGIAPIELSYLSCP